MNTPVPTPDQLQQQVKAFARDQWAWAIRKGFSHAGLHCYTDATGQPLYWKVRLNPPVNPPVGTDKEPPRKIIKPIHWNGSEFDCHEPQHPATGKPLYNLHGIAQADPAAEVWIVEGEQKADALNSMGLIAATSGNSSSANGADWQPLAGRTVRIWPDFDEKLAGQKYAAAVAVTLKALNCRVSVLDVASIRVNDQTLPDTGDVMDWLKMREAAGLTTSAADVLALPLVPEAEPDQPDSGEGEPDPTQNAHEGDAEQDEIHHENGYFRVTHEATEYVVFDRDGNAHPSRIAAPLHVLARTRNQEGQNWGIFLEWHDPEGRRHQRALPNGELQSDGLEVRKVLADGGLFIVPSGRARNLLQAYLSLAAPDRFALCTDSTGWTNGVFLTPTKTYGAPEDGSLIVYQGDIKNALTQRGTLQDWQQNLAIYARGNTRLMFSIAAALAAPTLNLIRAKNIGFHLRGKSSRGKSSAQIAACSVWGHQDKLKLSWNNTANGIEASAETRNDLLLVLDEIREVKPKAVGSIIYALGNGVGRGRMNSGLTKREEKRWRTILLSSGEETLQAVMESAGDRTQAGQAIRLLDIPTDTESAIYGIWETIYDFENGKAFSKHLDAMAARYHGTAGDHWLQWLVDNQASVADKLLELMGDFCKLHTPPNSGEQVGRAIDCFALVAAAGELATQAGITGWAEGEASATTAICFRDWLEFFGTGNHEDKAGIQQVRAFLQAHGSSRFEPHDRGTWQAQPRTPNRVGYWRDTPTGGREYLIFPEQWKNEVCLGLDANLVARTIKEAGYLRCKHGSLKLEARIPDSNARVRFYVVSDTILGSDNSDNSDSLATKGLGLSLPPRGQVATIATTLATNQHHPKGQADSVATVASVTQAGSDNGNPSKQRPVATVATVATEKTPIPADSVGSMPL